MVRFAADGIIILVTGTLRSATLHLTARSRSSMTAAFWLMAISAWATQRCTRTSKESSHRGAPRAPVIPPSNVSGKRHRGGGLHAGAETAGEPKRAGHSGSGIFFQFAGPPGCNLVIYPILLLITILKSIEGRFPRSKRRVAKTNGFPVFIDPVASHAVATSIPLAGLDATDLSRSKPWVNPLVDASASHAPSGLTRCIPVPRLQMR